MKRKLRGIKRQDIQLDFILYRVDVPIRGLSDVDSERDRHLAGGGGEDHHAGARLRRLCRDVGVPDQPLCPRIPRRSARPARPWPERRALHPVHHAGVGGRLNAMAEALRLPEKFMLVGHSFGGSICVEYANAYPERLEKLILIATAGEYPLPRAALALRASRRPLSGPGGNIAPLERRDPRPEAYDAQQYAQLAGLAAAEKTPHAHAGHHGRAGPLLSRVRFSKKWARWCQVPRSLTWARPSTRCSLSATRRSIGPSSAFRPGRRRGSVSPGGSRPPRPNRLGQPSLAQELWQVHAASPFPFRRQPLHQISGSGGRPGAQSGRRRCSTAPG